MGRYRFLSMLMFLLVAAQTFCAVNCWFAPYPAAFNVNLDDSEIYSGAKDSEGYAHWNTQGYNNETIIAVCGLSGLDPSKEYSIKVEALFEEGNPKWYYVSASEPYLKRPFCIDVIDSFESENGRKMERMGATSDAASDTTATIELTKRQQNIENNGTTYEAWADIVLYLPDANDNNASNLDFTSALSADDYTAKLRIAFLENGNEIDSNILSINGYVDKEPDFSQAQIFFSVSPNPLATSMNVKSLLVDGEEYEIGTYSYETQSFMSYGQSAGGNPMLYYGPQSGNNYYIFASASSDPTQGGGNGFEMYYNGSESSSEKFKFYIGLDSSLDSSSTNRQNDTTWFTGTDSMSSVEGAALSATREESQLGWSHSGDSLGNTLFFRDEGKIMLKSREEKYDEESFMALSLPPGVYSSTVYFHVVSDY